MDNITFLINVEFRPCHKEGRNKHSIILPGFSIMGVFRTTHNV